MSRQLGNHNMSHNYCNPNQEKIDVKQQTSKQLEITYWKSILVHFWSDRPCILICIQLWKSKCKEKSASQNRFYKTAELTEKPGKSCQSWVTLMVKNIWFGKKEMWSINRWSRLQRLRHFVSVFIKPFQTTQKGIEPIWKLSYLKSRHFVKTCSHPVTMN